MLGKLRRAVSEARADGSDTDGFTLIELLIVVVIIGILAAIAIPQFSSTKEQAYIATVKSDLRNALTDAEAYFAQEGTYDMQASDLNTSESVSINTVDGDSSTLCVSMDHSQLDNTWAIANATSNPPANTSNYTPGEPVQENC